MIVQMLTLRRWKRVRGERYLLGAHNLTYRELLTKAAAVLGKKPPRFAVPRVGTQLLSTIGGPLISLDPHRFAGLDPYVFGRCKTIVFERVQR